MNTLNPADWLDRLACKCVNGKYARMETRLNLGLAASMLLWSISTELSDFLIEGGHASGIWAWITVGITILIGMWVIHRYYRLYTKVDELTRKLLSNALSLSLGINIFGMMAFISLKDVGVWQPPLAVIFASIVISYITISSALRARLGK